MDGVIEGIGEVVSGGLVARAVEPEAGEAHGAATSCLNCRTELVGEYCHRCGQNGHVHRSLSAFGHDLLHGVLHFEGKIWRTLPMLAWHPGRLTRRYIEGERATFVSPMALFLFSVFLMFAVINSLGGPVHFNSSSSTASAEERAEMLRDFQQEQAESEAELKELTAELQRTKAAGGSTAGIEQRIAGARLAMKLEKDAFDLQARPAGKEAETDPSAAASEAPPKAAKPEKAGDEGPISIDFTDAPAPVSWFEEGYKKAKENPSLLLYKLQSNAYKFSWALIPISLPFVWLLFLHRRRYRQHYKAYDHVVFVTYSIAFMSLGFVALSLLRPLGAGGALALIAIAVLPPIHMYRQLRGAYDLSRFSALWRTFVLINFSFITTGIFLGLLLTLGLLG